MGFCNIDQPAVSSSIGLTRVVTSPVGYLRLHGRNAAMWFAEDATRDSRYDYLYTEDELQEILAAVEVLSRRARDLYVIANNHGKGQAAVNALQLAVKLRRTGVAVPPALVRAYPELATIVAPAAEDHP